MATDDLDQQLISLLQANARTPTADLARKLAVARTTVVARLARLERDGVIVGYTARLGQHTDRPPVRAHVGITVQPRSGPAVVAALQKLTELVQLSSVSGEFDYIALLRREKIMELLKKPDLSRVQVARQVGLGSERQLSRLIKS